MQSRRRLQVDGEEVIFYFGWGGAMASAGGVPMASQRQLRASSSRRTPHEISLGPARYDRIEGYPAEELRRLWRTAWEGG